MWAAIVKLLASFFGVADKVAAEVHDGHQRDAGRNEIKAADGAASAQVNADVAKSAVKTTSDVALDLLRDGTA